ncbi:hypothetical protein [Brachybacterium sp. AOP24-D1-21]|uniref:hypothetical protein n=1 Tax=Brachybacterium sp. AOP24-D1-21 TaxID=3457711 RepID=UPI004034CA0C
MTAEGQMSTEESTTAEGARTLVLLETIFCDYESDPEILGNYFSRFELTVTSLSRQEVPEGVTFRTTIYLSTDKGEWGDRVRALVARAQEAASPRVEIRIHDYTHPEIGYPEGDPTRVDWAKNPSKHSPYREQLFEAAHNDVDRNSLDRLLRVTIDDDDIWLPWHVKNLVEVAARAREDERVSWDGVLAIGLLDVNLGYTGEGGVALETLALERTLTGDKYYVIDKPAELETLWPYSPWSIPEVMDLNQKRRLEQRGIGLYAVRNYVPSFVYMRWGQNLSIQRKDGLIIRTLGRTPVASPAALLDLTPDEVPHVDAPLWFGILRGRLSVEARRNGTTVDVFTSFDDIALPDSEVCYYLMQGAEKVGMLPYSRKGRVMFRNVPPGVKVRAYHKRGGKVVERIDSRLV